MPSASTTPATGKSKIWHCHQGAYLYVIFTRNMLYCFPCAHAIPETPEAISANLTISGMNETTFTADKSVFEGVIADITNSSASSVEATFLEMITSVTTRDAILDGKTYPVRIGRSNQIRALINVVVKPRDTPHEEFALSKMNTAIAFREEINLGLQNQQTESTPSVISVSEIGRIAGKLIYVIRKMNHNTPCV